MQAPPRGALPAGWTPLLRADRLAEQLGLREVWIKNDAANPTHSFKDRVVSIALARARELGFETIACASTGNLANAVAAHAAAAGLESYVFIPSDLEEQKVLATGIYGTNLVAVRGNYDDVNRLCTELSGEHEWAFVNINMRPYYAEGSKTLAFETAEQLGCELPDRVVAPIASGSLFTKIARGFEEWIELGLLEGELPTFNGAQATGCSPVATAFEAGPRLLPAGQAGHDRQVAGDRQPGRRPLRARSGARARGGSIDSVTDDEIRDGIKLLARTTGIFTETAGGVTVAVLREARRSAATSTRPSGSSPYITGEGLKTLDCARGTFEAWEIEPTLERVRAGQRACRRRPPDKTPGTMAVSVKIPTQLRAATDGESTAEVEGATVGEVLDALYERYGELRSRIAEDGGLRRFVNVYVGGEDIRFLDGLDTPVADGDEVTILPAVAGG